MKNLVGPTARLTEEEAVARAEALRQQQHMIYGPGLGPGSGRGMGLPIGESTADFTANWQGMFYREGQSSID